MCFGSILDEKPTCNFPSDKLSRVRWEHYTAIAIGSGQMAPTSRAPCNNTLPPHDDDDDVVEDVMKYCILTLPSLIHSYPSYSPHNHLMR